MEKTELTSTFAPAFDKVSAYMMDMSAEAIDSFTIESLDLFSALIPSIAIWAREAIPSESLASRVHTLSNKPIDVYAARVQEPVVSGNPFLERTTLICPNEIDDLSLKRALFALDGQEEMAQRIMHMGALVVAGCLATIGSAPFVAACAYAPLYCIASAYTHDTSFLETFPDEKDALVKKRNQELEPPSEQPQSLDDLISNALFYAGIYLPAVLRRDIVESYEITAEPEPEIEPEPEVEVEAPPEPLPKPLPEPIPEPIPPVEEVKEPIEPPKEEPVIVETPDETGPRKRGGNRGR